MTNKMDDGFELPVSFHGKEFLFPAQLHQYGYVPKIEIDVNGVSILYERDEERNWRAIVDSSAIEKNSSINVELLHAIANSIEEILK
jgi:hypothetical protein